MGNPSQLKIDMAKVIFSLNCRPQNWMKSLTEGFGIHNHEDNMSVWTASSYWGLHFWCEGRYYGGINLLGRFVPWRRKMYKIGMAAQKAPHIKEWDVDIFSKFQDVSKKWTIFP